MKSKRMRIATTLVAAVAAVSMAAPTPAHASSCSDNKYTQNTCQELENLVCYLFRRCF